MLVTENIFPANLSVYTTFSSGVTKPDRSGGQTDEQSTIHNVASYIARAAQKSSIVPVTSGFVDVTQPV